MENLMVYLDPSVSHADLKTLMSPMGRIDDHEYGFNVVRGCETAYFILRGESVGYDPEIRARAIAVFGEPLNEVSIEYSRVPLARDALAAVAYRYRLLVDFNYPATSLPVTGAEVLQRLAECPDWDWRRR